MLIPTVVAGLSLAIWVYLALAHGRFWRTSIRLPAAGDEPDPWPAVVAVVPARDEADMLSHTLPTLVGQDYPGPLRVVLVDDDSADATATIARAAGATVVAHAGPLPGWAGKVAAMDAGLHAAGGAEYVLFTDADIAYPPDALRRLVRAAHGHGLVLTSQMVRLRAAAPWERWIVPAFVYFFAQLYPFARVNRPGRTAAAAGGCMLVRADALARVGGLDPIRDALIDDVALARLLAGQGRIWLGLSPDILSVRPYPRLVDLWDMVARSAYTQLRYSPLLLIGTVLGLLITYVAPPALTVLGLGAAWWWAGALAGAAWLIMAATFVPMLRFYRLTPLRALALPVIAALYLGMTVDSARRHRAGRGGAWKGRVRGRP